MTFEVPRKDSPEISLMQPDALFQIALRAFETMQAFQMEWWRALSGLIGQFTPSDAVPETMDAAPAEAVETEQPQPDQPHQPEASEAA